MFTLIINAFIDLANWLIRIISIPLPTAWTGFDASVIQMIRGDRFGQLLFRLLDVKKIIYVVFLMLVLRGVWWLALFTVRMIRG